MKENKTKRNGYILQTKITTKLYLLKDIKTEKKRKENKNNKIKIMSRKRN